MAEELRKLNYEPKNPGRAFRCDDSSVRYVINRESHWGGENHVVAVLKWGDKHNQWLVSYSGEEVIGYCDGPEYNSIKEGPFLLNNHARSKLAEGFEISDLDVDGIEKKTKEELISFKIKRRLKNGKKM